MWYFISASQLPEMFTHACVFFMVTFFVALFVTLPEVYLALMVTLWSLDTDEVVSTPPLLMEAYVEFSLQVAELVTFDVEPSSQLAVAV